MRTSFAKENDLEVIAPTHEEAFSIA